MINERWHTLKSTALFINKSAVCFLVTSCSIYFMNAVNIFCLSATAFHGIACCVTHLYSISLMSNGRSYFVIVFPQSYPQGTLWWLRLEINACCTYCHGACLTHHFCVSTELPAWNAVESRSYLVTVLLKYLHRVPFR